MAATSRDLFDPAVWEPALNRYGSVVKMSVALYDADRQPICRPTPATPILSLFEAHGYEPGAFAECVAGCLQQTNDDRPVVVVTRASGVAVVGISLSLNGRIVGAVVAGYALVHFCESVEIARLSRESGAPFQSLWTIARQQRPLPLPRLIIEGQLLQALGDALLAESDLRRRGDETARQLTHLATHDSLTGLANRMMLTDRLSQALAVAARHHRKAAVLFLDVDHFKHVNDSLGHLSGDVLLQLVGRSLTACVRKSDTVSRHGGDEFVVLLSELERPEDAAKSAQKIIAALALPHDVLGQEVHMTVSIGISVYPNDGEDAETLLSRADMALYHAKEMGRDGYQFFQPALNFKAIERRSIEASLHHAIAREEFELAYQPKISVTTGRIVGAEALLRWRHAERGLIAPGAFIPIAEDCGLIKPIGRWVVREACRQVQAWWREGLQPVHVAVNISAAEFRNPGFLEHMALVLKETDLDPSYLEVELTEGVLMTKAAESTALLYGLKDLGIKIAIDDFGTGWSSLSYLRHFAVDALKIDRSFVQEITPSSRTAPIVSAVINVARSLDLRVIAEGVETLEQLEFLRANNCDEAQGFYLGRPSTAFQFAALLKMTVDAEADSTRERKKSAYAFQDGKAQAVGVLR